MKQLRSEKEVKKALGISSFRNLSKEKIIEFVSFVPNIDKEVALGIINQFPNYVEVTKNIIGEYKSICNTLIEKLDESYKMCIESYQQLLNNLDYRIRNETLSFEEKQEITSQMFDVVIKIDNKQSEHNKFFVEIFSKSFQLLSGCIFVGAMVLGVNAKVKGSPKWHN